MSRTEWQVEMRTWYLRLEIVVLLHCLNLFIPIESIERDVSVLSHLYIILINKKQKMLKMSLHSPVYTCKHTHKQNTHKRTHIHTDPNVHRKQVAMNITYYSRLDLFSFFFFSFFSFFCFQENGKNDCMNMVI